jgi:hypothetical protein
MSLFGKQETLEVTSNGRVIGQLLLAPHAPHYAEREAHERPTAPPPSRLSEAFHGYSSRPRSHEIGEQAARYVATGLPALPPGTARAVAAHGSSMSPSSRATTVRVDLPPGTRGA